MRIGAVANASAAQLGAVPVEDQHRRLFALEHVDLVVGISRDCAGIAERLPWWQLCPVLDKLIRIFACANSRHIPLTSFWGVLVSSTPASAGQTQHVLPLAARRCGSATAAS